MSEAPVITAPPAEGTPLPPPAAGTPFHTDWLKADGTFNTASYDRLPEDVRWVKDTIGKYKTPEELARGFANLSTAVGKKGLIPLPDNAPPEARAERQALLDSINGVPKDVKDYGITRPQDLPEAAWNQSLADTFTKWAKENSVSPAAAKKLIALTSESTKQQLAAQEQYEKEFFDGQAKAWDTTIRAENMPADRANALAERGATKLGLDLQKPEHAILMKNSVVRLMAMRHELATGEDTFVAGDSGRGAENDPMALASDATHNKANPLYEPLHDSSHPQHRMAKEKLDGWWRAAAAKKR